MVVYLGHAKNVKVIIRTVGFKATYQDGTSHLCAVCSDMECEDSINIMK